MKTSSWRCIPKYSGKSHALEENLIRSISYIISTEADMYSCSTAAHASASTEDARVHTWNIIHILIITMRVHLFSVHQIIPTFQGSHPA
jgi:hypothetical protein